MLAGVLMRTSFCLDLSLSVSLTLTLCYAGGETAHRDLDFLRHINTLTYLLTYLSEAGRL